MKRSITFLILSFFCFANWTSAEIIVQNLELVIAATADEEMVEHGFDFDLDGTDDFVFQTQAFSPGYNGYKGYFGSLTGNELVCPSYLDVTIFDAGDEIGPDSDGWLDPLEDDLDPWGFFYKPRLAYNFGTPAPGAPVGNFVNAVRKCLGVRFKIDGAWHYGYAEVSNDIDIYPGTMTFHRLVYNDEPEQPIIVGSFSSIAEQEKIEKFNVYPNPALDNVDFNLNGLN